MLWLWIGVIVLAIVLELLTDQLVSIWFVPGAIVATVLYIFSLDPWIQIVVCLVISVIGIILGRHFFAKIKSNDSRTNIDAIIGEKCVVVEKIDNFAGCGQAKVKGQIWSARGTQDDDVFEVGEVLNVIAIEGVKLICKK